MSHYHAVVWIDHQKATVWQFTPTEQEGTAVHAHGLAYARRHFAAIDRMFSAETPAVR